ncbi:ferredoxin-thioredoxin reductase catalytic domain-containing protein [Nanoarchaeota archaeon]
MNEEEIKTLWKDWAEKQDFSLSSDQKIVDTLAKNVLENEKNFGYKFCPCRVRDGSHEQDVALLCPCNFKTHTTWESKGRCWCGLFVKDEQ